MDAESSGVCDSKLPPLEYSRRSSRSSASRVLNCSFFAFWYISDSVLPPPPPPPPPSNGVAADDDSISNTHQQREGEMLRMVVCFDGIWTLRFYCSLLNPIYYDLHSQDWSNDVQHTVVKTENKRGKPKVKILYFIKISLLFCIFVFEKKESIKRYSRKIFFFIKSHSKRIPIPLENMSATMEYIKCISKKKKKT